MLASLALTYAGHELASLKHHKGVESHETFCILDKEYFEEELRMFSQ
jgi:hypothetical protein